MSFMGKIKDAINGLLGHQKEATDKYFISKEIDVVKKGLTDSLEVISLLTKNTKLILTISTYLKQDRQYQIYLKALTGRAAQEENKIPLSGLKALIVLCLKELEYLAKYLANNPNYETSKEVGEVTFAEAAFLGIVEVSVNVERFSKAFLFKVLSIHGGLKNGTYDPQLIDKFFKNEYRWMANEIDNNLTYVTTLINKYGNFDHLGFTERVLNIFKKQNYDPVLINEGKANSDFLPMFEEDTQVSECAALGLRALNPFRWFGQRKVLKEHERILRQEYELNWMKNNITLLELQLNQMDPEDPKIKETQKIIEHYSELIAKISAEVDKYRNK